MSQPGSVRAAYDSIAADYDRLLQSDRRIRDALWRHYDRLFGLGGHVLDVGCGTGVDTIHLAERGVRVTAVDVSPGMVDELRVKLAARSLGDSVEVQVGEINTVIGALEGTFDGIVSSFAALNTVDLAQFAPIAARRLLPGGHLVAHMLAPGYRAVLRAALRSVRYRRVRAAGARSCTVSVGGERLSHSVLTAHQTYRAFFEAHFRLRRSYSLGLFPRPDRLLPLGEGASRIVDALEQAVGSVGPVASLGRFFVLDLERRQA